MRRLCSPNRSAVLLIGLLLLLTRCGSSAGESRIPTRQATDNPIPATSETLSISKDQEEQMPPSPPPQSTPDPPRSQPGQSPSGQGPATPGSTTPTHSQSDQAAAWHLYTDSDYGFHISYPSYYTIKRLSDVERRKLSPAPLATIHFQDQRGEHAALAPPQFSISVFANSAHQPLEDWLASSGLIKRSAGWFTEAYLGPHFSGIKASSPTFMAPGVFIYVAHNDIVFQLTPLGPDTERMLESFTMSQ